MALKHLAENPRQQARGWNLQLGVPGFKYADLNRVRRLVALDNAFLAALDASDPEGGAALRAYRATQGAGLEAVQESDLLLRLAPHVGAFIARLFTIEHEYAALQERLRADAMVFRWKRDFVERRVLRNVPDPGALGQMNVLALEASYREIVDELRPDAALTADPERELAEVSMALLEAVGSTADADTRSAAQVRLGAVEAWVQALAYHPGLAERRRQFSCFHVPQKLDHDDLVARKTGCQPCRMCDCVSRLQGGDYALGLTQKLKAFESVGV